MPALFLRQWLWLSTLTQNIDGVRASGEKEPGDDGLEGSKGSGRHGFQHAPANRASRRGGLPSPPTSRCLDSQ